MIYFSDSEIDAFIEEDIPYFDLTAELLSVEGDARIAFYSRQKGIISGVEEAARVCEKLGVKAKIITKSGTKVACGDGVLEASGDAKAVLKAWKPSQNILEYASAVASQTAAMLEAIRSVSPLTHFATTRKTIPKTKKLSLKAVRNGGGYAHRLGLSESVLIFAQYVELSGVSMEECVKRAKKETKEQKVAVEVKSVADAAIAAKAGADIIQCDKLTVDELIEAIAAVRAVDSQISIIATGGINLQNVASYAAAKPDVIVSSSVYYAKPFDIKVEVNKI